MPKEFSRTRRISEQLKRELAELIRTESSDPKLLMVPAAMSASCAFMLPVATGPNAVVFGSGRITIAQMAREGLAINLIGVVVISSLCWLML